MNQSKGFEFRQTMRFLPLPKFTASGVEIDSCVAISVPFLSVHFLWASKESGHTNRIQSGTGGTYYDFMPGIGYQEGRSSVRVFGQLPLYRNVRGIQLTLAHMFGLQFTYRVE
jgi:hypothetical protein